MKIHMRTFIAKLMFCFVLTGTLTTQAQTVLKLDQNQISTMGIIASTPKRVSSAWSNNFPAQFAIPNDQIRVLTPMLPGLINILYVAEGDEVKKGQKLAEILSPQYLEVQQNYLDALSGQALMSKNHVRNTELLNEGIISERDFATGQLALHEAEAFLDRSHQALIQTGMSEQHILDLKTSRQMNNVMNIRAPFDGTILKQTATTGEHVDQTTSLYHLGQLDPLWIEIHVPFNLRASIQLDNRIKIEGSSVESKVITIGQMVHEEDQGILVRGLIEGMQNDFIPGQFVNVTIEQKIDQGIFYQIPKGAIIRQGNDAFVFVKQPDGFSIVKIIIIANEGDFLVIKAQISPEAQIATKGIATLKGMLEGLGSEE